MLCYGWLGKGNRGNNPACPKSSVLVRLASWRIYNKSISSQRPIGNSRSPGSRFANSESPEYQEVAAILLEDNTGAERDITLHQRGVGLQRISDTLPAYDPLHFSLLFPHGERGWHLAIRYQDDATNHNNNRVSCLEFVVYRLYLRTNGWSLLLRAAKLLLSKAATTSTAMRASSQSGSPGASRLVV
jgi:hypothetical protein